MAGIRLTHSSPLTEAQVSVLCHNYAIKGVQMKFGFSVLDISLVFALYGQALYGSVVSRMLNRSIYCIYQILERAASRDIVLRVGAQRKYILTDRGNAAYLLYLDSYEALRVKLVALEDNRLKALDKRASKRIPK